MSFKTELHCHNTLVSACGRITPEETIERYLAAGYTSLVITDHISRDTFQSGNYRGEADWDAKVDFFLRSYHALKVAAKGRLNILLGAEVRVAVRCYRGISACKRMPALLSSGRSFPRGTKRRRADRTSPPLPQSYGGHPSCPVGRSGGV